MVGERNLEFLRYQGLDDVVCAFCDRDEKIIGKEISGVRIVSFDEAKRYNCPFVISVEKNKKSFQEIKTKLEDEGVEYYEDIYRYEQIKLKMDIVQINRDYCAYFHIDSMNPYFDKSEKLLGVFWDDESIFKKSFDRLDLTNVVELACGRGRHVDMYYDRADHITLVDVLEKNIDYCRERFEKRDRISYYKNNGFDLSELKSNSYTALFTYDAMVHFELYDIFEYLKETYRILVPGGKALFHHSNTAYSYKQSFKDSGNPGGRNFMTKMLFAHLAYKAGFDIVEQHVIDWSLPEMDCLTLVEKPTVGNGKN